MKTAHKWLAVGLVEIFIGGSLIFGAIPIIKSGKPGWGYAMIILASLGLLGSGSFAAARIYSSLSARKKLLESFPDRASWKEIPVYEFLDISPEQVDNALPGLEEAVLNPKQNSALNGPLVLEFIINHSK